MKIQPQPQTRSRQQQYLAVLFILYCLVLFKLLFFKLAVTFSDIAIAGNEKSTFESLLAGSNFVPFAKIYYYLSGNEPYLVGALNVVGNIVLFLPMGVMLPLIFPKQFCRGSQLLLFGFALSLCIEVLQLVTATGQFDVDDVLLNTAGVLLGFALLRRSRRWFKKMDRLQTLRQAAG